MKHIVKFLSVMLLLLLPLNMACEDDKNPIDPQEDPPPLPPESSLAVDFDAFTGNPATASLTKSSATYQNWGYAAANLVVWNTIVTVTMIVPVAAFAESFNHEPEPQDDGSWLWSYDFYVSGVKHTADLYGKIVLTKVKWDMYITKEGEYENFKWYSGESDLLAKEGFWDMNLKPREPIPFLNIEWHRNPQDSTADVKYTNVMPLNPEKGSYLFYARTNQEPFDATFNIYSNSTENLIDIQWHIATKAGRIKDRKHFGDEDWHCWDETLNDSVCE